MLKFPLRSCSYWEEDVTWPPHLGSCDCLHFLNQSALNWAQNVAHFTFTLPTSLSHLPSLMPLSAWCCHLCSFCETLLLHRHFYFKFLTSLCDATESFSRELNVVAPMDCRKAKFRQAFPVIRRFLRVNNICFKGTATHRCLHSLMEIQFNFYKFY